MKSKNIDQRKPIILYNELSKFCTMKQNKLMMTEQSYRPRIADALLQQYLQAFGAVCVEGPKWCGKTRTSKEVCNSSIFIGDPANGFSNRTLAKTATELVLDGAFPRLIDEWQEVPELWDAVRHKVDSLSARGLYVLTGSATPNHKGILHSGAGRIGRLRMRPMSLWESGDSTGLVSLKELSQAKINSTWTGEMDLMRLIHLIVRGGWPGSLNMDLNSVMLVTKQYIQAVLDDDATRIDGVQRDRAKLELVLRSLARHESTTASVQTLVKDIKSYDEEGLTRSTVNTYLDVYTRLFLIENQRPFAPSVRSSVRVKQAEKWHFCDPSLTAAVLKMGPQALLNDLNTLGFLFEALCERDLRIYAQALGGELFHYQDYKNQEIDAVVSMPDGQWMAFEIKLGAHQIDEAAANLIKIRDSLNNDNPKSAPSVLCVLCGMTNAAYQRPDGVFVVPITALKP